MGKDPREEEEDIPSDAMNFWYLTRFEDCIRHATKGGSHIERDDEGARGPGIGLAHV